MRRRRWPPATSRRSTGVQRSIWEIDLRLLARDTKVCPTPNFGLKTLTDVPMLRLMME